MVWEVPVLNAGFSGLCPGAVYRTSSPGCVCDYRDVCAAESIGTLQHSPVLPPAVNALTSQVILWVPQPTWASDPVRLLSEGTWWRWGCPVSRCCSANATSLRSPLGNKRNREASSPRKEPVLLGGEGKVAANYRLSNVPCIIVKPLVDFPLRLSGNKRKDGVFHCFVPFKLATFTGTECQVRHLLFWFHIEFILPLQKRKYPFELVTPDQSEVRGAGYVSKQRGVRKEGAYKLCMAS